MFNEIKYFIQRGRRGWSDRDAWDADNYLSEIIVGLVRRQKNGFGCPHELYDNTCVNNECHKWHEILEEIAQGFEASQQIKDLSRHFEWKKGEDGRIKHEMVEEKDKQLAAKYERGMELFAKYFMNLWD